MATDLSDADRAAIDEALETGHKINAIKIYREATGSSLKDAKEAVEAREATLRTQSPNAFKSPAANRGCLPLLLLVLLPAAIAILLAVATT